MTRQQKHFLNDSCFVCFGCEISNRMRQWRRLDSNRASCSSESELCVWVEGVWCHNSIKYPSSGEISLVKRPHPCITLSTFELWSFLTFTETASYLFNAGLSVILCVSKHWNADTSERVYMSDWPTYRIWLVWRISPRSVFVCLSLLHLSS